MIFENLIIGSGPTGLTVANELLKKGKVVHLIDIGNEIENINANLSNEYLKNNNFINFINLIDKNKKVFGNYKNQNLKYPFGSDFVFRMNEYENIITDNADYITSNALGGLSNIWATMVSPFKRDDIHDWPITLGDYYKYAANVENIMPLSSSRDNLDNFYDYKIGSAHNYKISNTSNIFLNNCKKRVSKLNSDGIFFGRAKSAISSKYSYNKEGCVSCGLCHFGCPNNSMFNSKFVFEEIKNNKNFNYHKGFFAEKIIQNKNFNIGQLEVRDTNNGKLLKFEYKNLFLSLGPIGTSMLILRSKLVETNKVYFKESQRFFLPTFLKSLSIERYQRNKNTLSEISLTILNKLISEYSIHLQVYSFSEIMLRPLKNKIGNIAFYLPHFFPFIFNKIFILLGYMHSKDSNQICLEQLDSIDNKYKYKISEKFILDTKLKINQYLELLKKNLDFLYINKSFLNNGITGSSYHYGGSFPMTNNSEIELGTSVKGILNRYNNIYICDQSVLPEMPGSPTTFNAMVNAARIVNEMND